MPSFESDIGMKSNKSRGIVGEAIALKHLESLGYEVIEQNYRHGYGEIDVICLFEDKLLVFVEVKRRKNNLFGNPESFVSNKQQQKILEVAEDYIHAINWKGDVRFDIIAIDDRSEIKHIPDAFY